MGFKEMINLKGRELDFINELKKRELDHIFKLEGKGDRFVEFEGQLPFPDHSPCTITIHITPLLIIVRFYIAYLDDASKTGEILPLLNKYNIGGTYSKFFIDDGHLIAKMIYPQESFNPKECIFATMSDFEDIQEYYNEIMNTLKK